MCQRELCNLHCLGKVLLEEVLLTEGDSARDTDQAKRGLKVSTQSSVVAETGC